MATTAGQSSIHDALEVLHMSGVKHRYDNYIGGKFVPPTTGRYFVSHSPINQEPICEFARSGAADVELALDAAHAIKDKWAHTSPADRATALAEDRRRAGGESGDPGACGNSRQWQAHSRDAQRRHSPGHRPLPLLRLLYSRRRRALDGHRQ